ncbi:MAG: hypothetical protein IJX33_01770 [Akkermansia sp.]|nr:hypothetical protein [Akkermansia sp.]
MGLREKLNEILPALLPEKAEQAIKGKELIARVRAVLGDAYSDHSLRSQFSFIALDPESCLARVENGQGYYLRSDEDAPSLQNVFGGNAGGDTMLHRAMALAVRLYDTAGQGVFVYPVDGEESWGHPDLVAVQWPAGAWDEEGAYIMEGEQDELSFRAICVGFAEDEESCRQAFFRALACGQWAQECELLLLPGAANEDELTDLAARYGVGIRCLDADEPALEAMPRADEIFRLSTDDARTLLASLPQTTLARPRHRELSTRAAAAMPDTTVVLQWARGCTQRGRVESFEHRVAVN